jgi:hypothetical protein
MDTTKTDGQRNTLKTRKIFYKNSVFFRMFRVFSWQKKYGLVDRDSENALQWNVFDESELH